jgi:hypothetical protein
MRRCLAMCVAVAFGVLSPTIAGQARATSFLRGHVFLQGQANASGTAVAQVEYSATLPAPSVDWLAPALAAVCILLLLSRRRRASALALLLAVAGVAAAALQVNSDAAGAYELSPNGGGPFAVGWYRLRFTHTGYSSQDRTVQVSSTAPAAVTVPDVTLQPLPPPCTVFPADNPWNTDISAFPVHSRSDDYIGFIGRNTNLHPDFGTFYLGEPIGIPYVVVPASQPKLTVAFRYASESDPGPYPIPPNPPIEGGTNSDGDRHILMVDVQSCLLYELYAAWPPGQGDNPYNDRWYAGSGAIFDLRSNALRPDGWTSADAAGLPIYAGLVRYDEAVQQGAINHALRFTVRGTSPGYIHPATHIASQTSDPNAPPMGLRVRMKASYNCSTYSSEVQVICAALKKYGMFVADNGSDWYVSGQHDPRWDDDRLGDLKRIPGSAFQVVNTGPILH